MLNSLKLLQFLSFTPVFFFGFFLCAYMAYLKQINSTNEAFHKHGKRKFLLQMPYATPTSPFHNFFLLIASKRWVRGWGRSVMDILSYVT